VLRIVPKNAVIIPESASLVYSGIIFDTYQWKQDMFDGTKATFEMLRRQDTVVAICIRDNKFVVLDQRQPNWPAAKPGYPAGRVEMGEEPLAAIKRETEEESGMRFASWRLLEVKQVESKLEWFVYLYLATDFTEEVARQADPGEQIEVRLADFAEVKALAMSGAFRMAPEFMSSIGNLEQLLAWPEYAGVVRELRDK
jgi:ADP-ribose pyrophosphatase